MERSDAAAHSRAGAAAQRVRPPGAPARVVIVGGGVAALEASLALARGTNLPVQTTLVCPNPNLSWRPLAVMEPFGGGALEFPVLPLLARHGVRWRRGRAVAVRPDSGRLRLAGGAELRYDYLIVATGAAARRPRPVGPSIGTGDAARIHKLLADLRSGVAKSAAFALPSQHAWPIPLYETALLVATHLAREHVEGRRLTIVTPEPEPLAIFGPRAGAAVSELLDAAGVELRAATYPLAVADFGLQIAPGRELAADETVWAPLVEPTVLEGLPERGKFVPVDGHGRIEGLTRAFAAGDVTSFPIKQGGLAAQQAEVAASGVLAEIDPRLEPRGLQPILRARLLTGARPLYLESRREEDGPTSERVSERPLWWPPFKIAARRLSSALAIGGA